MLVPMRHATMSDEWVLAGFRGKGRHPVTVPIPEKFHDLFTRRLLCAFTTINPNGQPHTVPVWCDYDGEHVRINVPTMTKKARNLKRNDKLSILIMDPENGGHWIEVQGRAAEIRDEAHGARDHINQLAGKYTGNPIYQGFGRGGEREMIIVEALKVNGN